MRRYTMRNGARLTLLYNSPLFYLLNQNLPERIAQSLGLRSLKRFDAIVWSHHNGEQWARTFVDEQCAGDRAVGFNVRRSAVIEASALDVPRQLQSLGFRGTLLLSSRAIGADPSRAPFLRAVCANTSAFEDAHMRVLCWDPFLRWQLDRGTEWDCELDGRYHQCMPGGPIDASADLLFSVVARASARTRGGKRGSERGNWL